MFDPDELVYLTAAEITEIHDQVIASDGGLPGVRPDLSIHGLVGRIESNLTYVPFENIAQLAALYAEVIARGHYFNDGNKRTALLTMVTFLDLNGYSVSNADQIAIADKMVEVATGAVDRKMLAVWLIPRITSQR